MKRNNGLATKLKNKNLQAVANTVVASGISYDTVNRNGKEAYSIVDEIKLISMLNTLKLEDQFYRDQNTQVSELIALVKKLGQKDPYFVCQAIKYSRCMTAGMRSTNQVAAATIAQFISGEEYAKRFFSAYNKKTQEGGIIYRLDDMSEIQNLYKMMNAMTQQKITNAMKKGFASVIENADAYQLCKYRKTTRDISNLVHPNTKAAKATDVLDRIMKGENVSADTWEANNSEAGQIVAQAVKEGKITKDEAEKELAKAKAENWEGLLKDGKLGILAALRNIRNIMKNPNKNLITLLCELISDGEKIRKGLIMPYQIDYAWQILKDEFRNCNYYEDVSKALQNGYVAAIPNLTDAMPGKTCVLVDCSGSMNWRCLQGRTAIQATAAEKAGLVAATIVHATGADVICFGMQANKFKGNTNLNVFALGREIGKANLGGTRISRAFDYISGTKYDRIILLSDNEANAGRSTELAYQQYCLNTNCNPYVYCIDFSAYGTTQLKPTDKVKYYFGYDMSMFEAIANNELSEEQLIAEIRKVKI